MGVLFKREACYGQIFAKHLAEMKKMYYSTILIQHVIFEYLIHHELQFTIVQTKNNYKKFRKLSNPIEKAFLAPLITSV